MSDTNKSSVDVLKSIASKYDWDDITSLVDQVAGVGEQPLTWILETEESSTERITNWLDEAGVQKNISNLQLKKVDTLTVQSVPDLVIIALPPKLSGRKGYMKRIRELRDLFEPGRIVYAVTNLDASADKDYVEQVRELAWRFLVPDPKPSWHNQDMTSKGCYFTVDVGSDSPGEAYESIAGDKAAFQKMVQDLFAKERMSVAERLIPVVSQALEKLEEEQPSSKYTITKEDTSNTLEVAQFKRQLVTLGGELRELVRLLKRELHQKITEVTYREIDAVFSNRQTLQNSGHSQQIYHEVQDVVSGFQVRAEENLKNIPWDSFGDKNDIGQSTRESLTAIFATNRWLPEVPDIAVQESGDQVAGDNNLELKIGLGATAASVFLAIRFLGVFPGILLGSGATLFLLQRHRQKEKMLEGKQMAVLESDVRASAEEQLQSINQGLRKISEASENEIVQILDKAAEHAEMPVQAESELPQENDRESDRKILLDMLDVM